MTGESPLRDKALTGLLVGLLLLGTVPPPVSAQSLGDRVRVRPSEGTPWVKGELADLGPDSTFTLQSGFDRDTFSASSVYRADWFKERSIALDLLVATAGGIAGTMIPPCDPAEGDCITGSTGGDAALGAGIGVTVGLVTHAIWPGSWKKWIKPQ